MAYAYHGGRLYLPRHPRHRVYELPESAVYFPAQREKFGRIRPQLAGPQVHWEQPHAAWLVLCHNDTLGKLHPECCVRNVHGDIYSYALCPSHPAVQDYCVELCRQAAQQPFVDELDIEALGWMGYAHNGLHEKCGVPLTHEETARLSQCHCAYCAKLDYGAEAALWNLLRRIRQEVKTRLNLRTALDANFRGGKFPCPPERLAELGTIVDAITLTYFGMPIQFSRPPIACEVHAGFVAHWPDSPSDEQRTARLAACRGANEIAFYSWSLADEAAALWMERQTQENSPS
jgi:hypothetical protein